MAERRLKKFIKRGFQLFLIRKLGFFTRFIKEMFLLGMKLMTSKM